MLFKKSKKPSFVFLFQETRVSAFFLSKKNQLFYKGSFAPAVAGKELETIIKQEPHIPYTIFYDPGTESFQMLHIPQILRGLDRYRWIQQKVKLLAPGATHFGHTRQRQNVLLVNISKNSTRDTIVARLLACSNPPRGFYALPLEETTLWNKLHHILSPKPKPWLFVLLLDEEEKQVRHTVLHQGHLFLMRVIPFFGTSTPLDSVILSETTATLRYLLKSRPNALQDMSFLCLSTHNTLPVIEPVAEGQQWHHSFKSAGQFFNFSAPPQNRAELFCYRLMDTHHRPILRLRPNNPIWRRKVLKKQILSNSFLIRSGFLLFCCGGVLGYRIQHEELKSQDRVDQIDNLLKKSEVLKKSVAALPFSLQEAQDFIKTKQEFNTNIQCPLLTLQKATRAMPSALKIAQFNWSYNGKDFSALELKVYPWPVPSDFYRTVALFDTFLAQLEKNYTKEALHVTHAPWSNHPTQHYIGKPPDPFINLPFVTVKIQCNQP